MATLSQMTFQSSESPEPKPTYSSTSKLKANRFLEELEHENAILEQELRQLMDLQDQRQQPLDFARFSFSQPAKEQPHMMDDSLEENPRGIVFEPCKLEEQSERSIVSTQLSVKHRKQATSQSMDPKSEASLPANEKEQYDSMLDTLMDSIQNGVKRPGSECKGFDVKRSSQVKSLEMRLSGTREALKSVEKELKEKNKQIEQLQAELQRKPREAAPVTAKENVDVGNRLHESVTELKKREKVYEKRLQENETTIKENKKYMIRLQELNSQLLAKVRQYEEDRKAPDQRIRQLEANCAKLESEKRELESQYSSLKASSDDYLVKTASLKENYKWMIERLEALYQ